MSKSRQAIKPRLFPLHPIWLGCFPVISLLANNMDQVRLQAGFRALLISLAGSALLYMLMRMLLRDTARAAVLSSFWLVLFFAYGHVYQLIEGRAALGFVYGKHRYLILLWAILLLAGSAWILRRLRAPQALNQVLNITGAFLLALPLLQIGLFAIRFQQSSSNAVAGKSAAAASTAAASAVSDGVDRDIYYIILDGYSRADVMQQLYGLDIQPFMQELESIGFVFPQCAQSNYGITAFSMFASLNMNYLDAYGSTFPMGSNLSKVDYLGMRDYLRHSQVRQFLRERGYQMVTFETGYWWLEVDDAEQYIVANDNPLIRYSQGYQVSNFEDLFLRTTALRVVSEANDAFLKQFTRKVRTPREHHYDVVRFALDQLDQVPSIPGKKFVYFHILAPHDPFVFTPDGSYATYGNDSDIPGYPNEVSYLNQRILQIVRSLISQSKTPPVIILQGDHGWDPRYRMQILNAYYLPDDGDSLLYPTITPVNTFRLVLNKYFGANYPLLEDRSYFSVGGDFPQFGIKSRPYQLTPMPQSCMGEK